MRSGVFKPLRVGGQMAVVWCVGGSSWVEVVADWLVPPGSCWCWYLSLAEDKGAPLEGWPHIRQFQQGYSISYANTNLTDLQMAFAISCKLAQLPLAKVRKGPGTPWNDAQPCWNCQLVLSPVKAAQRTFNSVPFVARSVCSLFHVHCVPLCSWLYWTWLCAVDLMLLDTKRFRANVSSPQKVSDLSNISVTCAHHFFPGFYVSVEWASSVSLPPLSGWFCDVS